MANKKIAPKTTVLLVNLGSPDDTSVPAVRRYLAEFLSDKRVIDLPRWQWWPILHGIILRTRPAKTAAAYRSIWTDEGSPLVVTTIKQCEKLQQRFADDDNITIRYAMRYGNPAIGDVLDKIIADGCQHLLVFPLYPQYSRATVETVRDKVGWELDKRPHTFSVDYIEKYYDNRRYVKVLADSIRRFQAEHERPEKLIFSYHGLPQRYVDEGDIYYQHCQHTTALVVKELGLSDKDYVMSFQSRFGREEWIKPYSSETLIRLAQNGVKIVHILSPAFSADCLETLEELEEEHREYFETAGGQDEDNQAGRIYRYIPALNDDERHIDVFESIIRQRLNT
ncbi:MAG: ferrochelatase [Gammaproteobacteria bacterium]|nr:MAG: ferrochelatase [Gammaproteobacteria bacterium]